MKNTNNVTISSDEEKDGEMSFRSQVLLSLLIIPPLLTIFCLGLGVVMVLTSTENVVIGLEMLMQSQKAGILFALYVSPIGFLIMLPLDKSKFKRDTLVLFLIVGLTLVIELIVLNL